MNQCMIFASMTLNHTKIKDADFIVLPEIPSTMGMLVHIPTTICSIQLAASPLWEAGGLGAAARPVA